MKELSIEEKVRAYNEALKKAKDMLSYKEVRREDMEYLFPELKESEDERIMKEIIDIIDSYDVAHLKAAGLPSRIPKYITWLEKQVEHQKFIDSIQIGDKVTRNEDGVLVNLSQLKRVAKKDEKQGEQKSIKTCAEYYNKDRELKMPVLSEFQDKLADILMHREYDGPDETEDDIVKGRLEYELAAIRLSEELLPLVQKEQKPADNVEPKFKIGDIIRLKDGDGLEWTVEGVLNNGYYTIVCADRDNFIQLDDKWELAEQKPAWSEGDYNQIETIACHLDNIGNEGMAEVLRNIRDKYCHTITKPTWKPSDEQIKGIECAIKTLQHQLNIGDKRLDSLYEDLKKLREE